MILADTSAWVEYDRATGSGVHLRLRELLEGDDLAVTDPVVAEVCAGARTDQCELDLRGLLGRCTSMPFDPAIDFDGAVAVYRSCRKVGVTPRGLIDCMIASVALRHDVAVLAHDVDLEHMAEVVPLRLDV
jgi:predicted nucleic acid-binding protein